MTRLLGAAALSLVLGRPEGVRAAPTLEANAAPGALMCLLEAAAVPATPHAGIESAQLVLGARAAWNEGRLDDARALLDEARLRYPQIADHLAVMLGEIELEAGDPAAAKTRFESAQDSQSPSVRLEARIGRVRALIELGAREANSALEQLVAEYPELPDAERLALARATAAEARGRLEEAVTAYRRLDLESPGSLFAAEARARLAALMAAGTPVAPFTLSESVARAERLTASGPIPVANTLVTALLAERELTVAQRRDLLRLATRIARVEGRFADVDRYDREFRSLGAKNAQAGAASTSEANEPAAEPIEAAPGASAAGTEVADVAGDAGVSNAAAPEAPAPVETRNLARERRARSGIARVLRGRSLAHAPIDRLGELADFAAGGALDDSLRVLIQRASGNDVPASVRYAVAMAAGSRPDFHDESLALLANLADASPELATGARYHRARLLERMGRLDEAHTLYQAVLSTDRSSGRYYTLWTSQRIAAVERRIAERTTPPVPGPDAAAAATAAAVVANEATHAVTPLAASTSDADGAPTVDVVSVDAGVPEARGRGARGSRGGRTFDLDAAPAPLSDDVDVDALAAQLESLPTALSATYPWIARAGALLRVRAIEEARTELFEALVAHRIASGRSVHRYGLEGVSRGVSRPSRVAHRSPNRRGRRVHRAPLEASVRASLSDVAAALGDHGTAIAFGGEHSADERPRAFAVEVLAAARKFDVDPNLLWAVMRVESVYQPRIVSYAGAIGLMQIMPRTGRLIAERLGHARFTTAQLLDPATNVEFAAWYLKSLVDRFDGHVPLAIAAYNGGPHNVRVWLDRSGPEMALDAFLERIPFDQTHRYVRRVLTHYAAYRARDGLPMIDLGVGVPPAQTDTLAF